MMPSKAKPRILLALFNETAAKGILDTSSIRSLAAAATLDLVHSGPIEAARVHFERVYEWPRLHRREMMWLAFYQQYLMPFTRAHYPERLGDQNLWQGFRPRTRRLLKLVDHKVGRAVVVPLLRWYLARTNPLIELLDQAYDAIVCITGLKDPLYEDLVRFGRARGIPVLGVTQSWDNVNYKPIAEHPDLLGVWGMQGYYTARLLHGFRHEQLVPVGAARMDVYFRELPEQPAARGDLGLPVERPILLFAGAGIQFEETSIVEDLDAAVSDGRLPSDLLILYKPHPRRVPRPRERPLDLARLRNVQIVPPRGPGSVSVNRMPVLLRAVDAAISPYSTLLLEAALCGRPSLAIAYDDRDHPAIKWSTTPTYIHLAPLAFAPWSLACTSKAAIVAQAAQLMTLVGRADLARSAREDALHVLHHDGRDFGARVADAAVALAEASRTGRQSPHRTPVNG